MFEHAPPPALDLSGKHVIVLGGDNVLGADLVVRAVHDGREAAAIARALRASELALETA
ncbi:MAG TPA: hypothetical protein VGU03_10060 [Frateuria sp.]|uniref:hypothetical protein n=1 Tax=Frateuria sp. TaxID=2211372 RepID=UPI002DECFF6D|nr:hypothetical protein [Frateuria sp.]